MATAGQKVAAQRSPRKSRAASGSGSVGSVLEAALASKAEAEPEPEPEASTTTTSTRMLHLGTFEIEKATARKFRFEDTSEDGNYVYVPKGNVEGFQIDPENPQVEVYMVPVGTKIKLA